MTEKDYKLWLQRFGGWIFIWLAVSVVILRWLSINQLSSVFGSASSFLLAFGRLTGLVGLVLYAINLLLAARTRWMENFFGGLNRVYIAHHLTGGIALILLCFHPLFIALRLVDVHVLTTLRDAARYLLPRAMPTDTTFSDFQTAASINAGIFAFVGMVALLVLTFFCQTSLSNMVSNT
jgi:predicted ferric reductase